MKAVFDTKPTSIYDDDVTQHYQFPRRYLSLVDQCVGDWIVFRRPRADGGNLAYFATARVASVEPDPTALGMSFARLTDFLQFKRPVPWTISGRYAEEALRNMPQAEVGVYMRGRSVRPLAEADFVNLIGLGLQETLAIENAPKLGLPIAVAAEAAAALNAQPESSRVWRVEQVLTNRIIRDASFRGLVCDAYENRCAVTNLRILDVSGNPEVQAAHIWAVSDGGPDVIQNGIALSCTVHWLFDRHLITVSDDYRLIVADGVPSEFHAVFAQAGEQLRLPAKASDWPHASYLAQHRNAFFNKNTS